MITIAGATADQAFARIFELRQAWARQFSRLCSEAMVVACGEESVLSSFWRTDRLKKVCQTAMCYKLCWRKPARIGEGFAGSGAALRFLASRFINGAMGDACSDQWQRLIPYANSEEIALKFSLVRSCAVCVAVVLTGCVETLPTAAMLTAPAQMAGTAPESKPGRPAGASAASAPPPMAPIVAKAAPSYDDLYADMNCSDLKFANGNMNLRSKQLLADRAAAMAPPPPSDEGLGGGSLAGAAGLGLMTGGIGLLAAPMLESVFAQATSQLQGQNFADQTADIKAHRLSISKMAKKKRCRL